MDNPLAISRWVWLSVVRAPMADQLMRSERYWGVTGSSDSVAQGTPRLIQVQEKGSGLSQSFGNVAATVQMRIIDQPFPPDRRSRFFKVGPHDDQQVFFGGLTDLS